MKAQEPVEERAAMQAQEQAEVPAAVRVRCG